MTEYPYERGTLGTLRPVDDRRRLEYLEDPVSSLGRHVSYRDMAEVHLNQHPQACMRGFPDLIFVEPSVTAAEVLC